MGSQLIPIDTVSRLIAGTLNAVLHDLEIDHTIDGVAVFRLETEYIVDVNLVCPPCPKPECKLSLLIHIPITPPEETTNA